MLVAIEFEPDLDYYATFAHGVGPAKNHVFGASTQGETSQFIEECHE